MTEAERYLILVEGGSPSNYPAWTPEVLGCVATGDTLDTCVEEMHTALASHIELMHKDGETIPEPRGPGVYIARVAVA